MLLYRITTVLLSTSNQLGLLHDKIRLWDYDLKAAYIMTTANILVTCETAQNDTVSFSDFVHKPLKSCSDNKADAYWVNVETVWD